MADRLSEKHPAATQELFPPGCTCKSYVSGLNMTRVNVAGCPVHGANATGHFAEGRGAVLVEETP